MGDAGFQKKCIGKMGEVARQGRTVLIVSHFMPVVMNLCERAILFNGGRIVTTGAASEVVSQYLASGAQKNKEMVWTEPSIAPGNDVVRLHSVRVVQDGVEGDHANIDIAKETTIEISYWSLQPVGPLCRALLKDQFGTPVLSSAVSRASLTDTSGASARPVGLYVSECKIPANFSMKDAYFITPILGIHPANTQPSSKMHCF